MAALTRLREDSNLPTAGWSDWVKAMVPPNVAGNNLEPRGPNQVGFICSSIRNAFPTMAKHCGIYEWRATRRGQPNRVVYVGSTCRGKPALRRRILEYCTNGSHKNILINDALSRGYELWVRVKKAEAGIMEAENMENELLAKYNYAWNIRNNSVRNIMP